MSQNFHLWMFFLKNLQNFRNCCLLLNSWFCSYHIYPVFIIKTYTFQRKNVKKCCEELLVPLRADFELKCEIPAHLQIAISCYYILFTNVLTWWEVETYIGDTPWQIKLDNDFINLISWLFLKTCYCM